MVTISRENNYVTAINVFTVEPAHQQLLLNLLTEATEKFVRNAPGFISASFHRGLDGTKVTVYAQWRSLEDYQAMRNQPDSGSRLEQIRAIASFEPGMYEVVKTLS